MSLTVAIVAQHGDRFITLSHGTYNPRKGLDTAHRVLQTLLILSAPSNRIAIEQELSFLTSLRLDDPILNYYDNPGMRGIGRPAPFPFINTCLFLGMRGCLRDSYEMEQFGALVASSPGPSSEIAIIDITNLDELRYCFNPIGSTTEDVSSYLFRSLYGVTTQQAASASHMVAHLFAKFELIGSIRVLPAPVGNPERNVPPRSAVKSLIDLCIAKLPFLFQSTESIDTTDYEVLESPHIKTLIWKYCLENVRTLATYQVAHILALALKGETHINLAPFPDLAPAAVRHVLQSCPEALSINLSGTAAMADQEIEQTLAAIDHDLDALYLLTPPRKIVGILPKEVMRALRNWNHRCHKLLISSVLAEGSRGPIPRSVPNTSQTHTLHQLVWSRAYYIGSKSFPITQIIYQSTFNTRYVPRSCPILAHVFVGGGFVTATRLWNSITKTIWNMNSLRQRETLDFTRNLVYNLAMGPSVGRSDKVWEVHSIPLEASYAVYNRGPGGSTYSDPGIHMCDLTPGAWTVVILRDEIPNDNSPQDELSRHVDTDRFRILFLRPKQVIIAGESQSITTLSFHVMDHTPSTNPDPSRAAQVLTSDQRRTVIQYRTEPHDVADAISAVQTVLDAAAAARNERREIEETGIPYLNRQRRIMSR